MWRVVTDLAVMGFDERSHEMKVLALHPGWVRTDMGGSGAEIDADESAAGLLQVIADAGPAQSGSFLDWRGEQLPW